jgi:hypothetical protein
MPRFQVYRMSTLVDLLLVWRSVRCDAPGLNAHVQHAEVENVSWLFHTLREPRQSTRSGPPYDRSCSRSKDGTCLMRLPSVMGGVRPLLLLRPFVKLTRMGGCRTCLAVV